MTTLHKWSLLFVVMSGLMPLDSWAMSPTVCAEVPVVLQHLAPLEQSASSPLLERVDKKDRQKIRDGAMKYIKIAPGFDIRFDVAEGAIQKDPDGGTYSIGVREPNAAPIFFPTKMIGLSSKRSTNCSNLNVRPCRIDHWHFDFQGATFIHVVEVANGSAKHTGSQIGMSSGCLTDGSDPSAEDRQKIKELLASYIQ